MGLAEQQAVRTQHTATVLQNFRHVGFRHAEIYHGNLQVFLQEQIKHHCLRGSAQLNGNIGQRAFLPVFVGSAVNPGNIDLVPACRCADVLPTRQSFRHFPRQLRPHFRVLKSFNQLFRTTGVGMGRNECAEHGAAGGIRILVE